MVGGVKHRNCQFSVQQRGLTVKEAKSAKELFFKGAVVQMLDYDELAAEYAEHRRVHPGILRYLIKEGNIESTTSVLEVGCGTGNYIGAIAGATGASCFGVDPSSEMLRVARTKTNDVSFSRAAGEKLEHGNACFDVVFCVDVIHHVDSLEEFVHQAYRVVKPGGKLLIATNSAADIRRRVPLARYFPDTVKHELHRYPRVSRLRKLMSSTGFMKTQTARVEFSYELTDIGPYRDKAFSCLHLISEQALQQGLARMASDLKAGPISCITRYTIVRGEA
jgi:ubiquinone/menaquinone biosynthesis C-methylase UbiE